MYDVNNELACYLKSKLGLNRLMLELKKKFVMISRFSGVILLNDLNEDECYDIGNLLGKKIKVHSNLRVSFKMITKKINEGKYSGFDWNKLFYFYFGQVPVTNAEDKLNKINLEGEFYSSLFDFNKDMRYANVLRNLIYNDDDIRRIVKKKYNKNKEELKIDICNSLLLLEKIPSKPISLAIYSSFIGNPHYLDLNKSSGNLFYRVLAKIRNVEFYDRTDVKVSLLSEINVYTDPVSNFVITYKLIGNNILKEISDLGEVVNLNLLNINNLSFVDTECKEVYVFENPSMVTALMDLNIPIIITSGIPNLSLYVLLDKLISCNNQIYYNGDFDPEGLLIACKLLERFKNVKLFCYDRVDYENSKSREIISDSRLKKLSGVKIKELDDIKDLLLNEHLAAYQEQNVENIRKFIISRK